MDVFQYRDSNRIITYRSNASDNGFPIRFNGEVVAYYIEDGFEVVSVPMKPIRDMSKTFMWYVSCSLVVLNEEKSVQELSEFLFYYLKEFNPKNGYLPSMEYCSDLISKCVEVADEEKVSSTRKFNFIKKLSASDCRKVIMGYLNNRKSTNTLAMIENAIEWLIIETNKFITPNEIVKACDNEYSLSTVRNYMSLMKDRIDSHNRKVFGTDNFMAYKKILSIHNIKRAIHVLNEANERLSRRKVADEAGVHFNTVQNLWDDDEIQEELDKFNKVV